MVAIHVFRDPCVCSVNSITGEIIVSEECITGDTVSDSLIVSDIVATANATAKIDGNYSNRRNIVAQTRVFPFMPNGSIVTFDDKETGTDFCMVAGFSLKYTKSSDSYSELCSISLEAKV